jgi:sugar phosphate isomerase/epimerase
MNILYACPRWGMSGYPLEECLRMIRDWGYDAVEIAPASGRELQEATRLAGGLGLGVISQLWFNPTGMSCEQVLEEYTIRLGDQASVRPLFINAHSGRDFYGFEENCRFVEAAARIFAETGVRIVHETHRGRATFSTSATRKLLETFPGMELTADFSHWCCVAESFLEDEPETLELAISRTRHIHARVGHPQGAQVSDPRAPEWAGALTTFLGWWDRIVERNRTLGREMLTITAEFGPQPYMPSLPFTGQSVSSQYDINRHMKDLLKSRYGGLSTRR